ncbi:MAG: histidine--tRNA ligase, partial [Clostridia bacterium]|nr:histidine--tRNA ligase [Clostridia bacterium]
QGTILGGGRYDGLTEELGGGKYSGVGFAAGIERLMLLMESTGVIIPDDSAADIYIAPMGEDAYVKAFETVLSLRKKGVIAETDHMARGIKAQFKYADKIKAKFVGVIGSDELALGKIKIKRMDTGEETFVDTEKIYDFIVGA